MLGLFTYGDSGPSNNDFDIEPSHSGHLSWPSGSVIVWQNADLGLSEQRNFDYSNRPPCVNEFTWATGSIRFVVTDATGRILLDSTIDKGVPVPSTEVPVINYWRFDNVAPLGVRTMHISSFAWAPLGQTLPRRMTAEVAGTPWVPRRAHRRAVAGSTRSAGAAVGGKPAAPCQCQHDDAAEPVHHRRLPSPQRAPVERYRSRESGDDHRTAVRGKGFARVGTVWRTVLAGRGRIAIWRMPGRRRIRPARMASGCGRQ